MTTPKTERNPPPPHTSHKRSRSPSCDLDDDDDYNPTPCPRACKKPKRAGSGSAADPIDLTHDSDPARNKQRAASPPPPGTAANPIDLTIEAPTATPSEEEQWLHRNFPRRRPNTMSGVTWTTFWPARPAADNFGRIRVGRTCYYDHADHCECSLLSGVTCSQMLTFVVVRDLDELAKPVPGASGRADFGRASLRTRLREAGIRAPIVRVLEERRLGYFWG
ncbi:hypothetical protein FN846DRAFT_886208 [Sphaerosporella brunnea]|uniref:Uncharacterized protein n=1 Tax=Sphaerosporella brunnea TaxID=1250544 RepID=A0A5J5FAH9_9PEZI|nr:hypothetical protein FN846DRAFT_886208 [Sphaerosporella brunnea]